jgi:hypothetical protein
MEIVWWFIKEPPWPEVVGEVFVFGETGDLDKSQE